MNHFDAAVYLCLLVAVIAGFRSGLLRSLATIFGYVAALPLVVMAMPYLVPTLSTQLHLSQPMIWIVLFVVFLFIGLILSAILRLGVSEAVGQEVSIADRSAGAMLGAVRVILLAVLMVLIFDRIIPADGQPTFLTGSKLRPILSAAGQQGLKSLPPDVATFIDRLKRERGI
jgi:membrane protein required for colicin V production